MSLTVNKSTSIQCSGYTTTRTLPTILAEQVEGSEVWTIYQVNADGCNVIDLTPADIKKLAELLAGKASIGR